MTKNISNGSEIFTVYVTEVGIIKITASSSGINGYLDLLIKKSILVITSITPEVINN